MGVQLKLLGNEQRAEGGSEGESEGGCELLQCPGLLAR